MEPANLLKPDFETYVTFEPLGMFRCGFHCCAKERSAIILYMCVYLHWGLFNVSYGVRPVSCKNLGQTKYLIKFCSFVKCRNISIKSQKYGTGISVFSFSSKFTSQVTDKKIAQLAFLLVCQN